MESFEKYKETNLFSGCSFKLKVFEVIHNQYAVMKIHWHEYLEIVYLAEGQPTLNIGTNTYQTAADDIFFVNYRQLHSGYSHNSAYVKYYAIVIDPSLFLGEKGDSYYRKYIMPYVDGTSLFPVKVDRKRSCYKKLKDNLNVIIKEYKDALPGFELKIKACLFAIFIDILRDYTPIKLKSMDHETILQDTKSINDLISHIYMTGPLKMTIKDAADYVRLNPYYFCKIFKKQTGYTFIQFFNLYKIGKAEDFLLYTNDTIMNIASELGFCNTNYFHKVIRELNGCSPSEFRKQGKSKRPMPQGAAHLCEKV